MNQHVPSANEAAQRDAADLLYRHGVGSILVSLFAASGLAAISVRQLPSRVVLAWWLLIIVVLLLRGLDVAYSHFRSAAARKGIQDIRRFGIGLTATAVLWAAFPIAFLSRMDQSGRAYTTIVLCGMVGGSVTVLAPSKVLSFIFCALLVLPTSIIFLSLPGGENTFLGVLGCFFFLVMFASSRVAHRATMTALRLSRKTQVLMARMEEQRQQTEAANIELKAAQEALSESNRSLEIRIRARTADLEREMQEKERYAKELACLASTDSLTGLANRGTLATRLGEALERAESAGQPLAVLFIDLDKFKEVNDVLGHPAGDRVLRAIAQRLVLQLPASVELARWGGDEFVVVYPNIHNPDQAIDLASSLSTCLSDSIETDVGVVKIDATIGIAFYPEHGKSAEDLIRSADLAMYASKEDRHSRIRLFDQPLGQRLKERHLLERALRDAVDAESLSLVFQPIITAADGQCETLEALARWNHPQRGSISPDEFIPLAERSGEIVALGRWVLNKACREAMTWAGPHPPAVAVNISAVQIESGTLPLEVANALKESGLPPTRLQLELTESVFAGDHHNSIRTLRKLREKGIKISLDDFGTGFSCLADLKRLPIDQIKIARPFVESLERDSGPIVQLILATAQTFGLVVVAEGVETQAQADRLKALGTHYLQGYFFSKTLSPEAARALASAYARGEARHIPGKQSAVLGSSFFD